MSKTYKIEPLKWAVEVDGNVRGYVLRTGQTWTATDLGGAIIATNLNSRDDAVSFLDN